MAKNITKREIKGLIAHAEKLQEDLENAVNMVEDFRDGLRENSPKWDKADDMVFSLCEAVDGIGNVIQSLNEAMGEN